jgi:thymidylate kinase
MIVIEFLGQARAGKTTQVLLLKQYLEQQGYRVTLSLDRDRAKSVHAPVSECLAFNLIFHSKVIDEYYQSKNSNKIDFFIVDRGFCDVAIWAEVLYRLKQISKKERDAYAACWQRFRKLVNLTFYFNVPLNILFERQQNLKTEQVDDVVMNKTWMTALGNVYEEQKKDFPHCVEIDGLKSIKVTAKRIQQEVEKIINKLA